MNSKLFVLLLGLSITASANQRNSKRPSVTETVQRQLNPENRDYGKVLQHYAESTLGETLENVYFWATVTSLAAATTLSFFALHLMQQRASRELIPAKLLAWYHNELACSRNVAASNNGSVKIDRRNTDVSMNPPASPSKSEAPQQNYQAATAPSSPDILLELSRLRQQITAQESTERVLRSQINALTKRLHEEKTRNKSIKAE
jgi:hypothetical protein